MQCCSQQGMSMNATMHALSGKHSEQHVTIWTVSKPMTWLPILIVEPHSALCLPHSHHHAMPKECSMRMLHQRVTQISRKRLQPNSTSSHTSQKHIKMTS